MKKPPLPQGSRRLRKLPRHMWRFLGDNWWPIVSGLVVIGLLGCLFGFKLLSLTHSRLSAEEAVFARHLQLRDLGLQTILRDPVNLPFQLLVYALEKLHVTSLVALRAISAGFGGVATIAFYFVLKQWHTRRVAILGTTLFATAAWTLHISRLAIPEILLMTPIVLILCATWLEVSFKRKSVLLLCLIASMLLVYVPGMALLVVAGVIWQAPHLYRELRRAPLWFVIPWIILGLVLLLPLGWMAFSAPHNLRAWLGVPARLPGLRQYGLNLINIPAQLVGRGPADPQRWLGRIPLLDLFSGLMFVLGVYAYTFRFRLDRTKLLAGIFAAGSLLIALGGGVTITFLMPFVYIIIGGGITLMLQQWGTVFPRNPFAKTLATGLMCTVVLLAAFYNLNHYFIAWPHAPETRQVFVQK